LKETKDGFTAGIASPSTDRQNNKMKAAKNLPE
jgi:hypothetical protein